MTPSARFSSLLGARSRLMLSLFHQPNQPGVAFLPAIPGPFIHGEYDMTAAIIPFPARRVWPHLTPADLRHRRDLAAVAGDDTAHPDARARAVADLLELPLRPDVRAAWVEYGRTLLADLKGGVA